MTQDELRQQLRSLHDATFIGLHLDWAARTASFQFEDRTGLVWITVTKIRRLFAPCEQSWGPSVSVNEIRVNGSEHVNQTNLELEIQSGDVIAAEGESIFLHRDELPAIP